MWHMKTIDPSSQHDFAYCSSLKAKHVGNKYVPQKKYIKQHRRAKIHPNQHVTWHSVKSPSNVAISPVSQLPGSFCYLREQHFSLSSPRRLPPHLHMAWHRDQTCNPLKIFVIKVSLIIANPQKIHQGLSAKKSSIYILGLIVFVNKEGPDMFFVHKKINWIKSRPTPGSATSASTVGLWPRQITMNCVELPQQNPCIISNVVEHMRLYLGFGWVMMLIFIWLIHVDPVPSSVRKYGPTMK